MYNPSPIFCIESPSVLLMAILGPAEPVHFMSVYKESLISASTTNRINVHSSFDSLVSLVTLTVQCFNTVNWAAGKASGCKESSVDMLVMVI